MVGTAQQDEVWRLGTILGEPTSVKGIRVLRGCIRIYPSLKNSWDYRFPNIATVILV